jgi:hypothetical protein
LQSSMLRRSAHHQHRLQSSHWESLTGESLSYSRNAAASTWECLEQLPHTAIKTWNVPWE